LSDLKYKIIRSTVFFRKKLAHRCS